MKDKGLIKILFEFLLGVLLMIPLIKIDSEKMLWIVISRMLYSLGIMLAITKLMSIVYRIISYIFRRTMLSHPQSYCILYFIFLCLGVVAWNLYSSYFSKGYFVAEIIIYLLFMYWFLLDIHITITDIKSLNVKLRDAISEHEKYVDTYKNDMSSIFVRKDTLVKELEQYFPKKSLSDHLKDLRRDFDSTCIDMYSQAIPRFPDEYKGINVFLNGQKSINKFENDIVHYQENLADDKKNMDKEKETYDGCISQMEKIVTNIKNSEHEIETLSKLGLDTIKFQEILERDIADAWNNRENIKQFWKLNEECNNLRRKNYGR